MSAEAVYNNFLVSLVDQPGSMPSWSDFQEIDLMTTARKLTCQKFRSIATRKGAGLNRSEDGNEFVLIYQDGSTQRAYFATN